MYGDERVSQPGTDGNRGMNDFRQPESATHVRYVGRRKYTVKAFSAQQVPKPASRTVSAETRNDGLACDNCEKGCDAVRRSNHCSGAELGHSTLCPYRTPVKYAERGHRRGTPVECPDMRAPSRVRYEMPHTEYAWHDRAEMKAKKASWWKGIMPRALVLFFVMLVLFLLFRPIPSSAEESGPLSMNLPQILTRMLPDLNLFVKSTGDDLVQIGKAYRGGGAVPQSSDPDQSLDNLIAGIKDINKEMGNTDAGNGMWDQVQGVFKTMRKEAWSVATQGGK